MSPNNSHPIEERRVESEIRRNEAEKLKFLREAEEIEKRIKTKLYSPKIMVQSAVAGIVVAGLLAAWGISYLKPIIQKNNELASLENRILSAENKNQMQLNEAQKKNLAKLKEQAKNELEQLKIQNSDLQKQLQISGKVTADLNSKLKSISKEYKELSKRHEATEAERAKYAALAKSTDQKSKDLDGLASKFKKSYKQTEIRDRSLTNNLIIVSLTGTSWFVNTLKRPDIGFLISFLSSGKLRVNNAIYSTNIWRVEDAELIMQIEEPHGGLHNGIYRSKLEGIDFAGKLMIGQAKNQEGDTWSWEGIGMDPRPNLGPQ